MISYKDASRVQRWAVEIAQHLGEGWGAQRIYQDHGDTAVILVRDDERIALVHDSVGAVRADRITFLGLDIDMDLSNPNCLRKDRLVGLRTSAALSRPAKAVASQIDRNLRPVYRYQLEAQRQRAAQRAAKRAKRQAEAARIADLLPGGQRHTYGDEELIVFSGPGNKAASIRITDTERDGYHYEFGVAENRPLIDDLVALFRKHSYR